MNIIKIGNYIMHNNNMQTDFMKAIMILVPTFIFENYHMIKII